MPAKACHAQRVPSSTRSSRASAPGLSPIGVVAGVAVLVGAVVLILVLRGRAITPQLSAVGLTAQPTNRVVPHQQVAPSFAPYQGLGGWLDVFDYSAAYSGPNGPAITPADAVREMADAGVQTLFLQGARRDDRSPGVTEAPWQLAEALMAAHDRDMAVVAWFLPRLDGPDDSGASEDERRITALLDFVVLGHRFDGIALDIEAEPEPEPEVLAARNFELIRLSSVTGFLADNAAAGKMPVGAVVLPPPLIEDVNPNFWPDFPWVEISPFYDVWLPMAYWSGRSNESGFGDGYGYSAESTRRIRANIGQPDAPVHVIGGIGGVAGERDFSAPEVLAGVGDYERFAQSLVDEGAIGGSIYDWLTQDQTARSLMTELFATGPAAPLSGG